MPSVSEVLDLASSCALMVGVGYLIRYLRAARQEMRGEFQAQTIHSRARSAGGGHRVLRARRHLEVVREGPRLLPGPPSSTRRRLWRGSVTFIALSVTLTPLAILTDPSSIARHSTRGADAAPAPPAVTGCPAVTPTATPTPRPTVQPGRRPSPPAPQVPRRTRTPRATPTPTPTRTPTPTTSRTPTPTGDPTRLPLPLPSITVTIPPVLPLPDPTMVPPTTEPTENGPTPKFTVPPQSLLGVVVE